MLAAVDVFKQLFIQQSKSLQYARSAALNLTDRTDWLKNFFMDYAMGNRGDLPLAAK
jgi:hypothetical protein